MKVGFHCDCFSLRGVTVATLAYARAWMTLGHESVLIKCDGQTPWIVDREPTDQAQGLQILRYEQPEQLNQLIKEAGIEALYVLTSGQRQARFQNRDARLWVHAVFPTQIGDIHGDRYVCISDWLAKECFNHRVPFVPHSVDSLINDTARQPWREQHGIAADAIVIGSMGGTHTFDLAIARNGLRKALESKHNLYFVALNHHSFFDHDRALFLPGTDNLGNKAAFISACDAMLHGRTQGETFGLACAEFTAAGKPVMAWRDAPERHHLEHFCPPSLRYSSASELCNILQDFDPRHWDRAALQRRCDAFRPEVIAPQFERVFSLDETHASAPHFSPIDRALIFKRRLQRSIRARLSQRQQQRWDPSRVAIDPASGFPVEG